ncbi:uncharacterized protein LOC122263412 [Penaeus japonicus]|uniref:uncharacterized protein LOC122263412 n=1 Tax=Penaeus japonicus TaxID=27405 RepID=UPI001C70CCE5|nr:uncharacterized protein LOC122263412 [Penaeus japonicus]
MPFQKQNFTIEFDDKPSEDIVAEFTTYEDIKKRLGHQKRDVHYLKIDIENVEWGVLPQLVREGHLDRVSQLAIEVHTMDIIKVPRDKLVLANIYIHILYRIKTSTSSNYSYLACKRVKHNLSLLLQRCHRVIQGNPG